MRIIQFILLAILAIAPGATFAADGGSTRVRALLVIASNEKGQSDARLSAYEPNLRGILRFESYRLAGEGTTSVASPGKGSLNLGQGHSLTLENQKSNGGGIRLQVNWQANGRSFMNTALVLRPGVPAVLGGPASGKAGEVWAVIVIAE
ncbi:MAG: hypothetical protein ABIZ81_13980 [Opitutaceae bacterium]